MITITVQNFEEIKRKFRDFEPKLEKEMKIALNKSLLWILRLTKENINMMTKTHTAMLKNRWAIKLDSFKGKLYSLVFYAVYVHEGTRPHVILPKIKQALYWKGAKYPVKIVHHPGTSPRKFLEKAVLMSLDKVKEFLNEAIKKVWESI